MNVLSLLYSLQVRDKQGKIVVDTELKPCNSFVYQFMQMLEAQLWAQNPTAVAKDTSGNSNSLADHANTLNSDAGVGITTWGNVVGTGTTAVAYDDYVLENKINHGVGAGQLSYGVQSKTATSHAAGNIDLTLTRTFNNGSGSTINVTEAGIYTKAYGAGLYHLLAVREVFAAVPVADGQTLTVNFTFRTTV